MKISEAISRLYDIIGDVGDIEVVVPHFSPSVKYVSPCLTVCKVIVDGSERTSVDDCQVEVDAVSVY